MKPENTNWEPGSEGRETQIPENNSELAISFVWSKLN